MSRQITVILPIVRRMNYRNSQFLREQKKKKYMAWKTFFTIIIYHRSEWISKPQSITILFFLFRVCIRFVVFPLFFRSFLRRYNLSVDRNGCTFLHIMSRDGSKSRWNFLQNFKFLQERSFFLCFWKSVFFWKILQKTHNALFRKILQETSNLRYHFFKNSESLWRRIFFLKLCFLQKAQNALFRKIMQKAQNLQYYFFCYESKKFHFFYIKKSIHFFQKNWILTKNKKFFFSFYWMAV